MSADLYTSEIDSEKYGDLFLELKVGGNLRFVLPDKIGHVKTMDDIDCILVTSAIKTVCCAV